MSNGTLYVKDLPRGLLPKALAKYFEVDINVVDADTSAEFKRDFPLGRVPSIVGKNDFILHEAMAVNPYLVELSGNKEAIKTLLGSNVQEKALIAKWMSLSNTEFFMSLANIFYMYTNRYPYHQDVVDRSFETVKAATFMFEDRLKKHKYLAADRITIADLFVVTQWAFVLQLCYGPEWRKEHPSIVNWALDVIKSPILKDYYTDFTLCEKTFEPTKK